MFIAGVIGAVVFTVGYVMYVLVKTNGDIEE